MWDDAIPDSQRRNKLREIARGDGRVDESLGRRKNDGLCMRIDLIKGSGSGERQWTRVLRILHNLDAQLGQDHKGPCTRDRRGHAANHRRQFLRTVDTWTNDDDGSRAECDQSRQQQLPIAAGWTRNRDKIWSFQQLREFDEQFGSAGLRLLQQQVERARLHQSFATLWLNISCAAISP